MDKQNDIYNKIYVQKIKKELNKKSFNGLLRSKQH